MNPERPESCLQWTSFFQTKPSCFRHTIPWVMYVMKPHRYFRRINQYETFALLIMCFGLVLSILCIVRLNARLRPILLELALTQTANCLMSTIDRTVSEQSVAYSDLITLERSEKGEVVALTSNMAQANVLRAELLESSQLALEDLQSKEFQIPIGTIFDWDILSGRGPSVGVKVLYTGTASAEFENNFSSAGINQTCHQIFFKIDADVVVLLPGRQFRTEVNTRVCVAETVIIGSVPETYLQIAS